MIIILCLHAPFEKKCANSTHSTLHCTAESEGYEQVGEVGSGETTRHKYCEGIQLIPVRQGNKGD